MFKLIKTNFQGFTLIEILISIVIISLVGIVFFPNLRGFNSTQAYQNEVLNIKNDLKKAQTMFTTGTRCSASKATTGWALSMTIASSNITSQLKAYCVDSSLTSSTELLNAVTTANVILQSSSCPSPTSIELKFDRGGFTYSCNGGAFVAGPFNIQLQNKNNTTQSTTISISSVGTISQN